LKPCGCRAHIETPRFRRLRLGRAIGQVAALLAAMTVSEHLVGESPVGGLDEYHVKAAFLYNFAKFVEWPSGTFVNAKDPITICVYGHDPFGHSLEQAIAGRAIASRSLAIRNIASVQQIAGCQILFIGTTEAKRVVSILLDIHAPGILTIEESDASGADGEVINLRLEGDKVRFDINVEAADRAKLRISSHLLGLAHIVEARPR
jgi:hypothetical protein